jgi:hypothetical protein
MAAIDTLTLRDLVTILENDDERYPFYGVLIYPPLNGLNQRLHEYVVSHWPFLNDLTGYNALLVALEDRNRGQDIHDYQPAEVYAIARYLGVSIDEIPSLVLFTEPRTRNETLSLNLREFFPDSQAITDDDLTALFQGVQAVIDGCVKDGLPEDRLDCLRRGIDQRWLPQSRWHDLLADARGAVIPSLTAAANILQALMKILPLLPIPPVAP